MLKHVPPSLAEINRIQSQGHSTAQSTGVGGHHASRFIPTVEREALNLVCVFLSSLEPIS